jgi:predicted nucleic acid-binding protein
MVNGSWKILGRVFIIVSASDELVMIAATFKARYPISYADGFAAARAIVRGEPLVTGDSELREMPSEEKVLKLEWIAAG